MIHIYLKREKNYNNCKYLETPIKAISHVVLMSDDSDNDLFIIHSHY